MPFFLKSCEYNPDYHWIFFTDCGEPEEKPDNVTINLLSYADYCDLVSAKLGISFYPPNPYKLCDIKPALGYIHADVLDGYEFWAFGDIDVIYGDLAAYFTPERLSGRWLLSTHHRRVSGHLCLIRNTLEMRSYFMRIPDWQNRFSDPEHQALDEGAFSRLFVRHKNLPDSWRHRLSQIYRPYRNSEFVEAHSTFTLWPDGRKSVPKSWQWRSGHLYNSDLGSQEMPYLHFLAWKKGAWDGVPVSRLCTDPDLVKAHEWTVTSNGIYAAGDNPAS